MLNSLIIREEETYIEKNFSNNVVYETLHLNEDNDISDTFLDELLTNKINNKEYQAIFLPLCFGPVLSDFNGLRLATHIRCTPSFNQFKNIFIFSIVKIEVLINHEYFNILKTKGVKLINYNYFTIKKHIEDLNTAISAEEISTEIKKLNLTIPANYEDSHSVANEWGIYKWAEITGCDDNSIRKIVNNQKHNLYFKYLKTIFPINEVKKIENINLVINYHNKPKILYIDDEANKGWTCVFTKILKDANKLNFSLLDDEFNEKDQSEIIEISINKIKNEKIDFVILDFRLHKDDFEYLSIEDITGYKILKEIKKFNKGIQVIIFSATNKIWNLQALHKLGADGFIIKESPENSFDSTFTSNSLKSLVSQFEKSFNLLFAKEIVLKCDQIISRLGSEHSQTEIIRSYFDIAINLLLQINSDKRFFNFAYLQLFQTIEIFIDAKENFIDGDDASVVFNGEEILVQKRSADQIEWPIKFNTKYEIRHDKLSLKNGFYKKRLDTNFKVSCILIFKLGNVNSSVYNWTSIYNKRNSYVAHNNSGQEINLADILEIMRFIEYLFNPDNVNFTNIDKGLTKKTIDESIANMREHGNFVFKKSNKKN